MAGWLLTMTAIAVAGREATRELSVFQVMLLRSLIGLVVLAPLVRAAGGLRAMRTNRLQAHGLRNVVHYAAQAGWLAALALIPLAHVVALEFTMPIWTALLAYAFLGEKLDTRKLAAIMLGMAGVALIVRPAPGATFSAGHLIALVAAVGFAVSVTMVKSLTRTDSATQMMFWMLVLQSVIGAVPAIAHWQNPVGMQWTWIVVVGLCGTCSHYCMARAMSHAEATVVVPMDFLRLPLTAAAGWALYAERFDLATLIGAALILGGNAMNLKRR
ncbi:MAG: DMT family transporter [Betaproteobacteria bacterium]|jgi:drug/metabolite transporter (DMT)-like permease